MSRAVWEWHRTQPSTTEIMALFGKHLEKPLSQAEDGIFVISVYGTSNLDHGVKAAAEKDDVSIRLTKGFVDRPDRAGSLIRRCTSRQTACQGHMPERP